MPCLKLKQSTGQRFTTYMLYRKKYKKHVFSVFFQLTFLKQLELISIGINDKNSFFGNSYLNLKYYTLMFLILCRKDKD